MNAEQTKIAKRMTELQKVFKGGVEKWKGTDEMKEYNRLQRRYGQVWKDWLGWMIADYTDGYVEYKALLNALKRDKIDHRLPTGFIGWIDRDGKWYTDNLGKGAIDGVPSGHTFPKVEMNDKYDPETSPWVFRALREDGTVGSYFYTKNFKRQQRKSKFETVADLIDKIDAIRLSWILNMKVFREHDPIWVASVILELLYQFSARIGSVGNGTEEGLKTFGISTLRVKHVKVNGTAIFRYYGKDGVKTKHILSPATITDKYAIDAIRVLMMNKGPSDYLFTYTTKGGKRKPVRASVVNDVFRDLGAGDATVHKLRTYHATVLARDLIAEFKTKRKTFRNAKDCHLALVKIAEKVGKKLNHVRRTKEGTKVTGATALANYIDVSLQKEFFDHYNVEYPKSLLRMIG